MVMERKYMKCPPNLPIIEAAKLMLGVGRRNLVIVNKDNKMLGTLSSSDILKYIISNKSDWLLTTVEEIMETNFIFLNENYSKSDAIRLFLESRIGYIPILNNNKILMDMKFIQDYLIID